MAYENDYSWGNVKRSSFKPEYRSRNIGAWTLLAVVLSFILHIALLVAFGKIEWEDGSRFIPKVFKIDRVAIDPSLMEDMASEPTDEPLGEVADAEVIEDFTPDELDLQEAIKDREVLMTPEVTAPDNFFLSERPAVSPQSLSTELDLGDSISDALDSSLDTMKNQLMQKARLADNQPLLDIIEDDLPDPSTMVDLSKMAEQLGGNTNQGVADGFANLDDLITARGKNQDTSKPIMMPTDLIFGYNQDQLEASAKLSLMKLGILIETNPKLKFVIQGHTDSFGAYDFNMNLSMRRAEAVRDWLVTSLQILPERMSIEPMGETRPIVPTTGSIEEQAANRRVEIHRRVLR